MIPHETSLQGTPTSTQNNILHIFLSFQIGWNMYIQWNL